VLDKRKPFLFTKRHNGDKKKVFKRVVMLNLFQHLLLKTDPEMGLPRKVLIRGSG
jgi:hypothetical protein